jgi:hypothetical protein
MKTVPFYPGADKPLPPDIGDICGETAQALRNSLDNAGYEVAVGSGVVDPKYSAFPFARTRSQMVSALGRSKDLPKEIQSLFVGFQPFTGGDDLLWALNEMCNTDKHKMVIPIGAPLIRTGVSLESTGWFTMPDPHVWDREKNEMEMVTLARGSKLKAHFEMRITVSINGIEHVDGAAVLDVLHAQIETVKRILDTIEFESKRLGYIK